MTFADFAPARARARITLHESDGRFRSGGFHNSSDVGSSSERPKPWIKTQYYLGGPDEIRGALRSVRVRPGAESAPATFTYSESDTGTACPSQTL